MIPEGVKGEFLTSCRVVKDQFVFVVINETSRWRRLFWTSFSLYVTFVLGRKN